jgi:hypothetical protein
MGRREDNIKMDQNEKCEGMDWIKLARWAAFMTTAMKFLVL